MTVPIIPLERLEGYDMATRPTDPATFPIDNPVPAPTDLIIPSPADPGAPDVLPEQPAQPEPDTP
jgi:hypothetical protein